MRLVSRYRGVAIYSLLLYYSYVRFIKMSRKGSSFKTMSGWLQLKTGHKWVGHEFRTSGVYLHYFTSGKEKVNWMTCMHVWYCFTMMLYLKATKTLFRNQIIAVKLSEKQHKGAENCFEVHFSGQPGSPWLLSAPSTVSCCANSYIRSYMIRWS